MYVHSCAKCSIINPVHGIMYINNSFLWLKGLHKMDQITMKKLFLWKNNCLWFSDFELISANDPANCQLASIKLLLDCPASTAKA